jgi:hypothetical protein
VLARTDADGTTGRKNRLTHSRGPLRGSKNCTASPISHERPTSAGTEGFWGLDSLAPAQRSASVDHLAEPKRKGSKRQLPKRPSKITRSTSLPKVSANEGGDDWDWDHLGTFDAGGSLGGSLCSMHGSSTDSIPLFFTDLGTDLGDSYSTTAHLQARSARPGSAPPIIDRGFTSNFSRPHSPSSSDSSEFINVVDQSFLSEPAVNRSVHSPFPPPLICLEKPARDNHIHTDQPFRTTSTLARSVTSIPSVTVFGLARGSTLTGRPVSRRADNRTHVTTLEMYEPHTPLPNISHKKSNPQRRMPTPPVQPKSTMRSRVSNRLKKLRDGRSTPRPATAPASTDTNFPSRPSGTPQSVRHPRQQRILEGKRLLKKLQ